MPWSETSVVQQRIEFISRIERERYRGKFTFQEICVASGISRETGYKWLRRYRLGGYAGLEDASRARQTQARRTPLAVEQLLVELKREFPHFGPKKLVLVMANRHPGIVAPAGSTAGAILKRHGLVDSRVCRRKYAAASELRPVTGPNATWCADFKGQFRLRTRQLCYPATLMDAHSRKLLRCAALTGTRRSSTLAVWESAFCEFGLPSVIRTDNGVPFAATHGRLRLSALGVRLIELGIDPEYTRPASPQENGALERLHRTLKASTIKPLANDMEEQQERFDEFLAMYNSVRPHEALNNRTPDDVYVPSPRPYLLEPPVPQYPGHVEARVVNSRGEFMWRSRWFFLAPALIGKVVGLERICPGLVQVVFFRKVVGMVDELEQVFIANPEWHRPSTEL